jgi:hypothetical protein
MTKNPKCLPFEKKALPFAEIYILSWCMTAGQAVCVTCQERSSVALKALLTAGFAAATTQNW